MISARPPLTDPSPVGRTAEPGGTRPPGGRSLYFTAPLLNRFPLMPASGDAPVESNPNVPSDRFAVHFCDGLGSGPFAYKKDAGGECALFYPLPPLSAEASLIPERYEKEIP